MQHKILYVEDEAVLGQLVKEALTKHGYDVLWQKNGDEAIREFKKYAPHLCLLDIMLPGTDGYDIATQIRAADKEVPIIFLTAKTQVSDLVMGFNAGCNDYVRKPFNMEELLLRINNWVAVKYGSTQSDAISIQIASFSFDQRTQLLSSPTQTAKLTHKEAELLRILCDYKNTIISREYILQKVWGGDSIYNSRSLDVYITKLRKYFKPDRHIDIITLRGIGYRFIY